MARNIEIKARIDSVDALLPRARLKLRRFADGQGDAEGAVIAEALMGELGLAAAPRVAGAYLDLLAEEMTPVATPDPAPNTGIVTADSTRRHPA